MRTLGQCLFDCDPALLRAIAAQWGIELAATRHHDAAIELAARMASAEAQADLASRLTPAECEALGVVLAAGGQMPLGAFTRHFGEIRLMGPGRLEREQAWADPHSTAESMWYNGLVYRVFDTGPGGAQEVVYIPPELHTGLHNWIAAQAQPAVTLPLAPAPEPGQVALGGSLADDVCTLLAYAHQHTLTPPVPAQAGGGDLAAWRRRHPGLLAQLAGSPGYCHAASVTYGDADAAGYSAAGYSAAGYSGVEFLLHLAERVGLLCLDAHRLRPDPAHTLAWLRASPFEQTRVLFEGWRDDPSWNELWRVPGLRCEDTGSWRSDPLSARQVCLEYLALMQPGQWYSLDGFIAAVKTHQPDFQRPGGDYDTWYIRDAQSGGYLRGFDSWDKVDGALLRYLLAGPLTWLGAVQLSTVNCQLLIVNGDSTSPNSLAAHNSQHPLALALTEMGAALLGKGEARVERGDTRFELSDGGMVRVGSARRYERFQLSRVADWLRMETASSDPSAGRVWVYQITPASLERARRQRIEIGRVISFLEESGGRPVPEVLGKALRRWERCGTEIEAGQAVVLRVARPELLEELMSKAATRRLIREALSPRLALVSPEHWPTLQRALLEMGVLVRS
ncbi:MAG: helicase-associated domain-containing protein [Thermoflexales bacterium]|nr:helicase-associated domain-containing protein [Thermoflexales bacterium]